MIVGSRELEIFHHAGIGGRPVARGWVKACARPSFPKTGAWRGGAHYLKQKKWKIENKDTVKNLRDYENLGGIDWREGWARCAGRWGRVWEIEKGWKW